MKAWQKKVSGLSAAALMVVMMSGCGGSGHLSIPNTTVPVSGGVTSVPATVNTPVEASATPQTVTLTVNGTETPVVIPAGVSVPAGSTVAVIPSNVTFISGLQTGARAEGDVTINDAPTGVTLVNGHLSEAIALPEGQGYTLNLEGPFTLGSGSSKLSIQQGFSFVFSVANGATSLPTTLSGEIPSNGSNNISHTVTASFGTGFTTGSATLTITHSNGTLSKTVDLSGGTATFTDLNAAGPSQIPGTGVFRISFSHL